MVILLLPHINPPGKAAQENTQPPGNVIVEVRWPDELDSDVDLRQAMSPSAIRIRVA
jgi:hypothetical protein